jgi:hypothetical protein
VFFVEALHPYEVLAAAGFEVDLASETGTCGFDDVSLTPPFLSGSDHAIQNNPKHPFMVKVAGLVYVASYVPDIGKSANDMSAPFGLTPGQKSIRVDSHHFASMSEEGILNCFAEGLPMSERRRAWSSSAAGPAVVVSMPLFRASTAATGSQRPALLAAFSGPATTEQANDGEPPDDKLADGPGDKAA